jgi:hypothetical protein
MRNHLFNFVTLRNPQTVSEADRSRYHILLSPDARETTHYFRDLSSDEFRELKFEIGRRSANFQNALSLQELRAAHADLLALYREVRSERWRVSFFDLDAFISRLGPQPLTPTQRGRLWDNFAHYLWVDPQEDEVGLVTAILIADKFLGRHSPKATSRASA